MSGLNPSTEDDIWAQKRLTGPSTQCIYDLHMMGRIPHSSLRERKLTWGAGRPGALFDQSCPCSYTYQGLWPQLSQVPVTCPDLAGKTPRMPGHQAASLGKPVSCRSLPPLHGKVQADGCPSGLPADVRYAPHMLALCSPTANTAWFVLGLGLEENRFPPKRQFLKNIWRTSTV